MAMTLKQLQQQLSGLDEYKQQDEATLRQQAESLYKPQYEQDLLAIRDSINANLAQQGRNAVATGMQRSSYNQAQQALIRGQGLRAQGELGAAYEGNVGNALLSLMNQEKDRKTQADQYRNQLLMSIYNYGKSGSGGGGRSSGGNTQSETVTPTYGDPYSMLNSVLNRPTLSVSNVNGKLLPGRLNDTAVTVKEIHDGVRKKQMSSILGKALK